MKKHGLGFTVLLLLLPLAVSTGCGLFVRHIPEGKILNQTSKDHFVRIGSVNYHYVEYPADGEDVFLLHGYASSTYTWEKVAPILNKAGLHVWALDMKGFGWSDKPRDAKYDPVSLMEDVNDWMDYMGLSKVTFVGNSLGGGIAFMMAIDHPDKVKRLVLIDPAIYPQKPPLVIRMSTWPGAVFTSKLIFGRWMIRMNLHQVYYHRDWVTKEQVNAYYDRLRTENALYATIAVARAIVETNPVTIEKYAEKMHEMKTHTLLIWGGEDRWIPIKNGYRLKKDLPNAILAVIPECGHIPQEEKPAETATLIKDFIMGKPIKEAPIPG